MVVATMYVERVKNRRGSKVYEQVLLRESYRDPGEKNRSRVKHRTLLNLSQYPEVDVTAIELGLKWKHDLGRLAEATQGGVRTSQGRSVGAVWLLYQMAQRLGLESVLGRSEESRRALWQVLARLIGQGSRLSAVRLAQEHAACEILGLASFTEDHLYANLDWLDKNQRKIEQRLFRKRYGDRPCRMFLYDVTSTYLEGQKNGYAQRGYNRDGKKGKLQIVIGLLTDAEGDPISVEVFEGSTSDPRTVLPQIRKIADGFGVREITFVGDRGMIKSAQIEQLKEESFYYLTAITKPQIRRLLKTGDLQLTFFDESLCEVFLDEVRYILRRNPTRADTSAARREGKFEALGRRVQQRNQHLAEHPGAQTEAALRQMNSRARQLGIDRWVHLEVTGREISLTRDAQALEQISALDGCYVLKSNLPREHADAETLHARYKGLTEVERAIRTIKTAHLEVRPVYVRTHAHTRAHVFIVMLAFWLRRRLEHAWRGFDVTVEEAIKELTTLCATEVALPGANGFLSVPEPRTSVARLFTACDITPPTALPQRTSVVATKRKLTSRRKPR